MKRAESTRSTIWKHCRTLTAAALLVLVSSAASAVTYHFDGVCAIDGCLDPLTDAPLPVLGVLILDPAFYTPGDPIFEVGPALPGSAFTSFEFSIDGGPAWMLGSGDPYIIDTALAPLPSILGPAGTSAVPVFIADFVTGLFDNLGAPGYTAIIESPALGDLAGTGLWTCVEGCLGDRVDIPEPAALALLGLGLAGLGLSRKRRAR